MQLFWPWHLARGDREGEGGVVTRQFQLATL